MKQLGNVQPQARTKVVLHAAGDGCMPGFHIECSPTTSFHPRPSVNHWTFKMSGTETSTSAFIYVVPKINLNTTNDVGSSRVLVRIQSTTYQKKCRENGHRAPMKTVPMIAVASTI
jgi:hypothetical protein